MLERPISKGIDEFPTNKSLYPLTQPIPKIESLAQTSGKFTEQNTFMYEYINLSKGKVPCFTMCALTGLFVVQCHCL